MTRGDEEMVEFEDVTAIRESDLAICVRINGEQHWIPQSQIHDDSEVWKSGQTGTLVITRWLAEQKGLV